MVNELIKNKNISFCAWNYCEWSVMLKFIRSKGNQQPSVERQKLQKELFAFRKVSMTHITSAYSQFLISWKHFKQHSNTQVEEPLGVCLRRKLWNLQTILGVTSYFFSKNRHILECEKCDLSFMLVCLLWYQITFMLGI